MFCLQMRCKSTKKNSIRNFLPTYTLPHNTIKHINKRYKPITILSYEENIFPLHGVVRYWVDDRL